MAPTVPTFGSLVIPFIAMYVYMASTVSILDAIARGRDWHAGLVWAEIHTRGPIIIGIRLFGMNRKGEWALQIGMNGDIPISEAARPAIMEVLPWGVEIDMDVEKE